MSAWDSYDDWLTAPYEDAAAEQDAWDEVEEWLADDVGFVGCGAPVCRAGEPCTPCVDDVFDAAPF